MAPLPVDSLPVQVLLGVYLGLLTGIVPAIVAGVLGFVFKYVSGVTIPGFGVVVLGLAIAGVNGGLLALNDPAVRSATNAPTLLVAIIVVLMLTLYTHAKGDALGARLPRRLSLRTLANRTLSTDVIEIVDARRRARVRVTGEVSDVEGYPGLPADLRASLRAATYTFPADLPLGELERRTAERLRQAFDLAAVRVDLDDRGRATVAAAPPVGAVSRRVDSGERAVSLATLVPTGVVRGDAVTVTVDGEAFEGRVVAARSGDAADTPVPADARPDGGEPTPSAPAAPATRGGPGRITVAVPTDRARPLLERAPTRVAVRPRESSREYELVSLLRRAGNGFDRVTVREGGPLDGVTAAAADARTRYGVAVLAVRSAGEWRVGPPGETTLSAGEELYVAGRRDALAAFREAVGE